MEKIKLAVFLLMLTITAASTSGKGKLVTAPSELIQTSYNNYPLAKYVGVAGVSIHSVVAAIDSAVMDQEIRLTDEQREKLDSLELDDMSMSDLRTLIFTVFKAITSAVSETDMIKALLQENDIFVYELQCINLSKLDKIHPPMEWVYEMVKESDKDDNGCVTLHEYAAVYFKFLEYLSKLNEQELFGMLDYDNDGSVNLQEVCNWELLLGLGLSEKQLEDMFDGADEDQDKKLTQQETKTLGEAIWNHE